MKRFLSMTIVLFAFTSVLSAQHPNDAPGFAADHVYNVHDLDTVNVFNGNLIVRIPIGPTFKVNGTLSYGLSLTYNSHFWRFEDDSYAAPNGGPPPNPDAPPTPTIVAYPPVSDNAGLGWRLSLGKLYQGSDPDTNGASTAIVTNNLTYWTYQSSDGADHELTSPPSTGATPFYTHDSSYIRLTLIGDVTALVEMPDGTVHTFKKLAGNADGNWSPSASATGWFLTKIADPFGNAISITYASSNSPYYKEIWTIDDGARSTTVYFKNGLTSSFNATLDHINLKAIDGQTASYGFAIETIDVPTPRGDSSGRLPFPVPVLKSITPPLGNAYNMTSYDNTNNATSGVLTRLQLPTLGSVGWTYQLTANPYVASKGPRNPAVEHPTGIVKRTTYDANGATVGEWTYERHFSRPNYCEKTCADGSTICNSGRPRQETVFITDPSVAGSATKTTISYFSDYEYVDDPDGDTCAQGTEVWVNAEHGLPFTRYQTADQYPSTTKGRFLSSEVRTGFIPSASAVVDWLSTAQGKVPVSDTGEIRERETYVTYRLDSGTANVLDFDENASLSSAATYYMQDSHCGSAGTELCFTATNYGLFDGYGHYKQASTEGNMPGSANFRTTFTNYSAAPTSSLWLLTPFTEQCRVDESMLRGEMAQTSTCGDLATPPAGTTLSGPFVKQYCFDATGFLTRQRSLAGTAAGAHDLLAVFSQQNGNVTQEDYYGGDGQTLTTGAICSTTPPDTSEYRIFRNYLNGVLQTSYHRPNGSDPIIYDVNNTIDPSTGLVKSSTDSAGLTTSYSYDLLGRLMQIARPGEAPIKATYTEASTASPAQFAVEQDSEAGTILNTAIFDSFGRISEERRLTPAGTAKRQTVYTASGLTQKVSEWEDTPSHFTVFSNFDAFGRPMTITAPDQTEGSTTPPPPIPDTTTKTTYVGARQVMRTVSVGASLSSGVVQPSRPTTTETYDAAGRLIDVNETDGLSKASYSYDAADHLTTVNLTDVAGTSPQPRTFSYDGRGLLTSEQHPENGTTIYKNYDSRGHAGKKLVGSSYSPFDLKYDYDALERLVNVYQLQNRVDPPATDQTQIVKQFTFATANDGTTNHKKGKLETATRTNYLDTLGTTEVKETYSYSDAAGRLTKKVTEVTGPNAVQKYEQSYTYNNLGVFAGITYPTCPNLNCAESSLMLSTVSPAYQNGLVTSVPNFATAITYDLNGMVTEIDHPGSVNDSITVDSNKLPRPARIQFNSYDPCAPPHITAGPTNQQIASGSHPTLQVTASGTSTLIYQWFKDGATTPMAGETTASCCSTTLTTSANFSVEVINSCGKADSQQVAVAVCGSPAFTTNPQSITYSGTPVTLTATATGCSLTYQWYIGDSGNTASPTGTNSSSLTVSGLQTTTHYWVRVTDSFAASANSLTAIVTVATPLPAPGPLSALFNPGTNMVVVAWGISSGADHYELQRLDHGSWSTSSVFGTSISYTLAANTTYVFHIRAVDASGGRASSYTANDLATTIAFPGLQPHVSFNDFDQIRTAINAIRAAHGDAALTWRQMLDNAGYPNVPEPAFNAHVYGAHLLALRAAMDAALSSVQVATAAYTDSLASRTFIRAVNITELQQRAQ